MLQEIYGQNISHGEKPVCTLNSVTGNKLEKTLQEQNNEQVSPDENNGGLTLKLFHLWICPVVLADSAASVGSRIEQHSQTA